MWVLLQRTGNFSSLEKISLSQLRDSLYSKILGGLEILELEVMNISLLAKCLWKLFNQTGLWQQILEKKYLQHQNLCQSTIKSGDPYFWALMDIKPHFFGDVVGCKWGMGGKPIFGQKIN
jgi:hypothetical protein